MKVVACDVLLNIRRRLTIVPNQKEDSGSTLEVSKEEAIASFPSRAGKGKR